MCMRLGASGAPLPATRLGLILVIVGAVIAGCGDDGSASGSGDDLAKALGAPQRCLANLGASRAHGVADIDFSARDFQNGDTVNPATAGDGTIKISEYRPVVTAEPSGRAPRPDYVLWVGQPADESELDPIAAVKESRSRALVMFLEDPDHRQIKGAMDCLDSVGVAAPTAMPG